MYGLVEMQKQLEDRGVIVQTPQNEDSQEVKDFNHAYYQGLLLEIGNRQHLSTYVPNQDKNKLFGGNRTLGQMRTYQSMPQFTSEPFMRRAETVDVSWFRNGMPTDLFEVEHTTDIQNSLLKYCDLSPFSARMVIVADKKRKPEFENKLGYSAFDKIKDRVQFLDYESLEKQYEMLLLYQTFNVGILGF